MACEYPINADCKVCLMSFKHTNEEVSFLLARLHLEAAEDCLKQGFTKMALDELESMPDSLDSALEDTICRIPGVHRDKSGKTVVKVSLDIRVLMWMSRARAILSAAQLAEALSTRDFPKEPNIAADDMTGCCTGLIIYDSKTAHLTLVHKSIMEYLNETGPSTTLFPRSHEDIAITCLAFLSQDDFHKHGPMKTKAGIQKRIDKHPFLTYAAREWGKHAALVEKDDEVIRYLDIFLSDREYLAAANQILQYRRCYERSYWKAEECRSITPIHMISRNALRETLKRHLAINKTDINRPTDYMKSTPVMMAAAGSDVEMLKILLQGGADPYQKNKYGNNALLCAAQAGCCDSIKVLVGPPWKMPLNAQKGDTRIPIYCTLKKDKRKALELLVKKGAQLDNEEPISTANGGVLAPGELKNDFLRKAVEAGACKIVRWLFEGHFKNVDINADMGEGTLLQLATANGKVAMADLLVTLGAKRT
jgi:hypothetical protein